MRKIEAAFFLVGMLTLLGCSRSPAPEASGQKVTLQLKNGTAFTGSVTKQDNSSITLRAANGESRTFQLSQVASEKFAETIVPAAPAPQPPAAATGGTDSASATAAEASKVARVALRPEELHMIPGGTTLMVRNRNSISTSKAGAGEFPGVILEDVRLGDGKLAIPRGSNAMLSVRPAKGQDAADKPDLVVFLDWIEVRGDHYNLAGLALEEMGERGPGRNKSPADFTFRAPPGIVVGSVPGGTPGVPLNDLSFSSASPAENAAHTVTRGKSVKVPGDAILSFQLTAPVAIRPAP